MGVWKPTKDGKIECTRHTVTFPKGGVCAMCAVDPPPAAKDGAAAARPRRARRGKLPTSADHEAAFVVIAELAETWAREEDEEVRTWVPPAESADGSGFVARPTRSVAAKLLAEAIKARRAAATLAMWREDWDNTERVEKAARELNDAGKRMRATTAASEVRH